MNRMPMTLAMLVLATAAACSTTPRELDPVESAPPAARPEPTPAQAAAEDDAPPPTRIPVDPAAAPARVAELRYLVTPDGQVVTEVPPAILADVRAQLTARGATRELDELDRLYDTETGHARDAAHAKAAEAMLRAEVQR